MRVLALTLVLLAGSALAQKASVPSPSNPAQPPKESIVFWNMSHEYVNSVLDRVPQSNPLRLALLKRVFQDLQCTHLSEQPTAADPNLICTLSGAPAKSATSPDADSGDILFIAHYEHDGPGQSAVENWSGAVMLPFLYHALSATPRHHTFLFADVSGTIGAKTFYNSLTPGQRHALKGVVSFDALGLGPPEFYISSIDNEKYDAWNWLYRELRQTSRDQRVPDPALSAPGDWLKSDSTTEFRHHGIPSILIHSVPQKLGELPASAKDNASSIDRDAYARILTLLSYYAVLLDQSSLSGVNQNPPTPSGSHRRH